MPDSGGDNLRQTEPGQEFLSADLLEKFDENEEINDDDLFGSLDQRHSPFKTLDNSSKMNIT